jgi:hypothetical protein
MGKKGNQQRIAKAKAASKIRLSLSNTTNTAANQPSNASNPPPNVLVAVLDPNLLFSAASAADLPQSQEIQFPATHDDMDTSHNDPNEANTNNNDLSSQQFNLLVPPILANQNLSISAAPAADLLQSQEIQTPGTHDDMDTSQNNIYDANYDLFNQWQNLLLLSNSNTVNVVGMAPQLGF